MADVVNASLFLNGANWNNSYLKARGWSDPAADRSGGITVPRQVEVPPGTILFRTFGGGAGPTGQWWFTPHELTLILDYFGRADVGEGRQEGRGILHAVFAVLKKEWKSTCEFFTVIELKQPFFAFYGEGDDALLGPTGGQKAVRILVGNSQRRVRQLMIPNFRDFQASVTTVIAQQDTDTDLVSTWKQYATRRQSFET